MIQFSPRLLITIFFSISLPTHAQQPLSELPDCPGKELVEAACVACHNAYRIR